MTDIIRIEEYLIMSAVRSDMHTIIQIVNRLTPQQKAMINRTVFEEALLSAAAYAKIEPVTGSTAIMALMRSVGYLVSREIVHHAARAYTPAPSTRARIHNSLEHGRSRAVFTS